MYRAAANEILKNGESYYSLVIAVAKRARDIAQKAEDEGEILTEKPVTTAIDDFVKSRYRLIEQANIGAEIE